MTLALAIIIAKAQVYPDAWYRVILTSPLVVPGVLICSALLFLLAIGQSPTVAAVYWSAFSWLIPRPQKTCPNSLREENQGHSGSEWLERLAALDEGNMAARIFFSEPILPLSVKSEINRPEPFLDFSLEFLNRSVFELTVSNIDGRLIWNDSQFQQPPQLTRDNLTVGHGDQMKLAFRQMIRPNELAKMKAEGKVLLDIQELTLSFNYLDRQHKLATFALSLPSMQITISA